MHRQLLPFVVLGSILAVLTLWASGAFSATADDLPALFGKGMAAMEESQSAEGEERDKLLDEAIASFRQMLVVDPRLVRVRLELARAFFLKGQDRLAKRHFEQVLAGEVPREVAANVRSFLFRIRARRRWEARFGFAIAPDTNIGAGSEERIIYIDIAGTRLPFTRDAEDLTTSGIGLSLWTGGEYQYPLADRIRLRAGANLSQRDYEQRQFDQTSLGLHAGPRWLISRRTEASILASGRRQWSAGAPDHDALGSRLEIGHRFTRRITAYLNASWHDRSYRTREHLDGPAADASNGGNGGHYAHREGERGAGLGTRAP